MRMLVTSCPEHPLLLNAIPYPEWVPSIDDLSHLLQLWNWFRTTEETMAKKDLPDEEKAAIVAAPFDHFHVYMAYLLDQMRDTQIHSDTAPEAEASAPVSPSPPLAKPDTGWVYILSADQVCWFKIGMTRREPTFRVTQFAPALPFTSELLYVFPCSNPMGLEAFLHERFAAKRLNGEWFALDEGDIAFLDELEESLEYDPASWVEMKELSCLESSESPSAIPIPQSLTSL